MRWRAGPITGATGKTYGVRNADVGFRLRVEVTAKNANGSGSALSNPSSIAVPSVPITNARPTVKLIAVGSWEPASMCGSGSVTTRRGI